MHYALPATVNMSYYRVSASRLRWVFMTQRPLSVATKHTDGYVLDYTQARKSPDFVSFLPRITSLFSKAYHPL